MMEKEKDKHEVSSVDLTDDDSLMSGAEEMSLLSHHSHRRTSSLDSIIVYTRSLAQSLQDPDVIRNGMVIAVLVVLWHSFSMSISIYNKWMFSGQAIAFPFPLFMTCLHQAVQFALSALLLYLIPSLRPRRTTLPPSAVLPGADPHVGMSMTRFYLTHLVPCGVANALDIGLGNMSLRFSTLTFMTVCKSSVLVFILLFAFLFRLEKLSVRLVVIIAFMTVGEVMMVLGELSFSMAGFTLVTASAFFSGFRWALTQLLILKHPATSNPISMLFFLSPVVCVTLAIISLSIEDTTAVLQGLRTLSAAWGGMKSLSLLLLPGILAFCMVLSQYALLKRSSVVTLSICGILKEVVIISAAGLVFGDQLTAVNVCGVLVIMASIVAYNYTKLTRTQRPVELKAINEKHS